AIAQNEQGVATLRFEPTEPRLQLPYSGLYWQIDRLEPGAAPEAGLFRSRSLWDQTLHLSEETFPPTDANGLQTLADPRGRRGPDPGRWYCRGGLNRPQTRMPA